MGNLSKTAKEVANIWAGAKGSNNKKAIALCKALNLIYEVLPRSEYKKNGKEKQGDTDGFVVRTRKINDEFDLFTLFHEIGHTQLHWTSQNNPVYFINDLDRIEREADKFAADVMFDIFGAKIEHIVRVCMI